MPKFKAGDKVRRVTEFYSNHYQFDKGKEYTVTACSHDTVHLKGINFGFAPDYFELVIKTKTILDVDAGDYILSKDNARYKVEGRIGDIVFTCGKSSDVNYAHVKNLIKFGFSLEEETKVEEMTMEEVCKALGKNIKIKK